MKIIPVSEAKRQIKELVEQAAEEDQVYYITRYSQAQAVMLGVEQYEGLLQRIARLEDEVRQIWTAVEDEEIADSPASSAQSVALPTADRGWRASSPQILAAIRRAARLAWQQRDWMPEQSAQAGRRSLNQARQMAIEKGVAVELETEAALND